MDSPWKGVRSLEAAFPEFVMTAHEWHCHYSDAISLFRERLVSNGAPIQPPGTPQPAKGAATQGSPTSIPPPTGILGFSQYIKSVIWFNFEKFSRVGNPTRQSL